MVEGHSVHRVASMHRKRLVGKSFTAWSPNGRFTEGANAINGKIFSGIEAYGKNLFAFFDGVGIGSKDDEKKTVVMHVHFGMAGNWAVYMNEEAPEPTKTNRLRLEYPGIIADLSAMTVQHGCMDMYNKKRTQLGEDPLRKDADPERLWSKVKKSSKSIGALIMDQSYFTGPGNIYRAEICFKAGIHPNRVGKSLLRQEFDSVWYHTKNLLERGYSTGSILTVDPEEALALGKPKLRRYIYNTSKCSRCSSAIKSWKIASRTCYACPKCQPQSSNTSEISTSTSAVTPEQNVLPFNSHCARESVRTRLFETGPSRLTVKELRSQLMERNISFASTAKKAKLVELLSSALESTSVIPHVGIQKVFNMLTTKELKARLMLRNISFPSNAKKATLVDLLLSTERNAKNFVTPPRERNKDPLKQTGKKQKSKVIPTNVSFSSKTKKENLVEFPSSSALKEEKVVAVKSIFISSEIAAAEKAAAGESLAVEHTAELAPYQARSARNEGQTYNSSKQKLKGRKSKSSATVAPTCDDGAKKSRGRKRRRNS